MLKILYLIADPTLQPTDASGYAIHMRELVAAMRQCGVEVQTCYVSATTSGTGKPQSPPHYLKKCVPAFLWQSLRDWRQVRFDKQLNLRQQSPLNTGFAPDLIYERSLYLRGAGLRLSQQLNIPIVYEHNEPVVEERRRLLGGSALHGAAWRLERAKATQAAWHFVVGKALMPYLENLGADQRHIQFVGNGVNFDEFKRHANHPVVAQLRQQYQLTGKRVIGYVGSFLPWHDFSTLIAALRELPPQQPDWVLCLVGEGMARAELAAKIAAAGLTHKVRFSGKVPLDAVASWLELFDVGVVNNTTPYCFPLKLLQYGAMQIPVLVQDAAWVADIIPQQDDAWVFRAGDVKGLTAMLSTILAHPDRARDKAQRLYQHFVTHFSWQTVAQNTVRSMQAMIGSRR